LIYTKYTKYYPLLVIEVEEWNDNCVRAYSLNTHDANGELMVGNSPKFTSENVNSEFTLEKVFGTAGNPIIAPIEKSPTNEYVFEFRGWNTEGVLTFTERDYKTADNTIQESVQLAENACAEKLIIAWEGNEYVAANGFDFSKVFDENNQELNIYPTFVATVRTWTATFIDGLGNTISTQAVRYGEKAEIPTMVPIKLELDPNLKDKAYVYPFLRFGSASETFIVVNDKTYEAVYATSKVDIHNAEVLPSADYFDFNTSTGTLTLSNRYFAEAICFPKMYNGEIVKKVQIASGLKMKRIYFEL